MNKMRRSSFTLVLIALIFTASTVDAKKPKERSNSKSTQKFSEVCLLTPEESCAAKLQSERRECKKELRKKQKKCPRLTNSDKQNVFLKVQKSCRVELRMLCSKKDKAEQMKCLLENKKKLSSGCKNELTL